MSRRHIIAIYILPLIVVTVSTYIHGVLLEYSDIYSISQDSSRGDTLYGVPYRDFRFEYPPMIGLIWYISSLLTRLLGGSNPLTIHVYSLFMINAVFYVIYVLAIDELVKRNYFSLSFSNLIFSIASFSMIYYLMYNWDIVAISLAILSMLLLFQKRYYLSFFVLSLSVLSKIFTIIFVIPYLYYVHEIEKKNKFLIAPTSLLISLETILAGFSLLMLISPGGFQYFISHHSSWYCENCFYIMFTSDIWDPLWRAVSSALMISIPLVLATYILIRYNVSSISGIEYKILTSSMISLSALVSVSYVYSPQMNIMLAPIYLILRSKELLLMCISDFLNTLIMILWFRSDAITNLLGLPSSDPHLRTSPIQWIAFARIILLWIVIYLVLKRISSSKESIVA